jgi:hypothetical protein
MRDFSEKNAPERGTPLSVFEPKDLLRMQQAFKKVCDDPRVVNDPATCTEIAKKIVAAFQADITEPELISAATQKKK